MKPNAAIRKPAYTKTSVTAKPPTRPAASRRKPVTTAAPTKPPASPNTSVDSAARGPAVSQRNSKQAQLIARLGSPSGATIPKMMALTGWQAHTVRGIISGVLRKKLCLKVICETSAKSGERIYRIATPTTPA